MQKSVAMDMVLRFNINREYLKVEKRVEKAFKYRIYPNAEQEILLQKTFGCCRFVFNHYLAKRKETYEQSGGTFNYYDYARDVTQLNKFLEWLHKVDSTLVITSDGVKYPNNRYTYKAEKQLQRLQRSLSRKAKGSANRSKARIKAAKLQEGITNRRLDCLPKVATELVKNYDTICIEDLKPSGM